DALREDREDRRVYGEPGHQTRELRTEERRSGRQSSDEHTRNDGSRRQVPARDRAWRKSRHGSTGADRLTGRERARRGDRGDRGDGPRARSATAVPVNAALEAAMAIAGPERPPRMYASPNAPSAGVALSDPTAASAPNDVPWSIEINSAT